MKYRSVGKSGLKISEVALGSWVTDLKGTAAEDVAKETVKLAYDSGVNFFDCADAYSGGAAERFLGKTLKQYPRKELVISSKVYFPTGEGVNDRVQLAALSKTYNRRVCERWMRDGVTILDPETTWIEDDVQIGRDATILPGSFLQGHTVVGEDAIVGPYTTLIDATVDEGAVVERSRVQESHIGARTNIGPWTYLRPGNEFGEDAKAGAFVEMKKAHIGNGTKVPHLSYVGDAQLGDHTNIGGGTITANYDGVHKNRTTIGSGCHVGAGNLFVAPVEVGDNVTTGAGSVVRHAVPSDTMVYSENTQHNVEGWKPAWER